MTVDVLGRGGDGLAYDRDGCLTVVPGALPGETVLARLDDLHMAPRRATLLAVESASPERVTPPCPLFARCGGCAVQHLALPAALNWKAATVRQALAQAGFAETCEVSLSQAPAGARRRMDIGVRRTTQGLTLGFHARGGDLLDVRHCLVLAPALDRLLTPLHDLMIRVRGLRRDGDVVVNLLDSGPDILVRTDGALTVDDRALLAAFARAHDIPRIAWAPVDQREPAEIAAQIAPVRHRLAGHAVVPPPGAFLQATADSEAAIRDAVLAMLPPRLAARDEIIELYAGCGTLTFGLAERGRVLAVEGNPDAATCLKQAAGGLRISVLQRDLNRQPLMARELAAKPVVVLDPPRMGAGAQMREIASGAPQRVVYVSCNPQALTKDAALLKAAGYSLAALTIIDQFVWSAEVEAIALFTAPPAKRARRR
ncbi:class I SAM-dependent RNA methyltransferase [Ameyamaea chiangmaiensis]|uniref:class I SAM-dependent RNA methyltransferase n=1 Tax=Ameyamaea chiangmaiensis TaxID=442969 RepID=UPI001C4006A9|nr:class I SAM-dependent RNA methyltransferase [Ameyamaea chiangmaiensis]